MFLFAQSFCSLLAKFGGGQISMHKQQQEELSECVCCWRRTIIYHKEHANNTHTHTAHSTSTNSTNSSSSSEREEKTAHKMPPTHWIQFKSKLNSMRKSVQLAPSSSSSSTNLRLARHSRANSTSSLCLLFGFLSFARLACLCVCVVVLVVLVRAIKTQQTAHTN